MAETSIDQQSADNRPTPVENGVSSNHVNGSSKSHSDGHKSHSDSHRSHGDSHKSKSSSSGGGSSSHSSSSKHHSSSHKSSSSDKHRDDKPRSSSDKDKHRSDKDRSDKHKSSSSSSSSKHHSSSSSKSSSEHKSSSSSSSSKHRESSSSKHGSSSSRDKDREKDRSHDKDRKDRDRHRDDKDRIDRDKHSGSDRDKSKSSSSSKHRESNSSISRNHGSSKSSSSSSKENKPKILVETEIKREDGNESRQSVRMDSDSMVSPKRELMSPPPPPPPVKTEMSTPLKGSPRVKSESEDDVPLSSRKNESAQKPIKKRRAESDDSDDAPLTARAKKIVKKEEPTKAKKRPSEGGSGDSRAKKARTGPSGSPRKKGAKEEPEVWKWWEEEKRNDGVKWRFLEHKGPLFAPPYERMPKSVKFYYNGEHMRLSQGSEEVAGFYGKMLEHDYTTKPVFNDNFFKDWRKVMTEEERLKIKDLKKCNFKEMLTYFQMKTEERKAMPKEEKKRNKEQNDTISADYGFCTMDGHKEKIGNFRIEPPGLFRGRGDHPKQGRLKTRTLPEDIIINCSKDSNIPKAPDGHKWKQVRHDNSVTWLVSWNENIQGAVKYIMLNASSRLKGEKDWAKYETARKLKKIVNKIRANYTEDFKSKEMRVRQRAVAMYFIDKLALRAGNEKEDGESADTVGCCSLRVEHITLHEEKNGKESVVEFDFLGKDSIRYYNCVPVEKRAFKNLQLFKDGKNDGDDLFDRLNTSILNQHLQSLMEGLTAKVFRTYNASKTLQDQLDLLTMDEDNMPAKLLSYNRANRAVAVLCNHQRAAPKNFDKQMENLQLKIDAKNDTIRECKREVKSAKSDYKNVHSEKNKSAYERKKTQLQRLEEQLTKLEVQQTDKDENKEIALGTSKLNYLDPRISVAWCKKHEVPIEKIYNKTQRDKFRWAIDMAGPEFVF